MSYAQKSRPRQGGKGERCLPPAVLARLRELVAAHGYEATALRLGSSPVTVEKALTSPLRAETLSRLVRALGDADDGKLPF